MDIYISLGAQCTTATLFEQIGVKKESLPFDWMFSTPEFVYTILKLLLIDNLKIDRIITDHFCIFDKRASRGNGEHYITNDTGAALVNSKYNVCFPHDIEQDTGKYFRRIRRLKQLLLDKHNFIYFVYVSPSSQTISNYKLDDKEPIQNLYSYILKINNILKSIRTKYKIMVFDTSLPKNLSYYENKYIYYFEIQEKNTWMEILPELKEKFEKFLRKSKTPNYTRKLFR